MPTSFNSRSEGSSHWLTGYLAAVQSDASYDQVLDNPCQHTGAGYQTRQNMPARQPPSGCGNYGNGGGNNYGGNQGGYNAGYQDTGYNNAGYDDRYY